MREPSLKWVLIAAIVGMSVFLLTFTAYSGLLVNNNATISNNYTIKYQTMSNYQNTYSNWGEEFTAASILQIPTKFISTFLTAVTIGMSALSNLFSTLTGIQDILRSLLVDDDFKDFRVIISLLLTVFTIYLVYRLLSEVRGVAQS